MGRHLADQLLLPLALLGGGRSHALELTPHFPTNVESIHRFLGDAIRTRRLDEDHDEVVVSGRLP